MTGNDNSGNHLGDDPPAPADGKLLRFPQSRVRPRGSQEPFKRLGAGALAARLGFPERQATGHWCSRCRGIWYGYPLEVACPVCGNRHG